MSATIAKRAEQASASPAPSVSNGGSELDPLLKDLTEKKQSFRRSVVSLASELKDARTRLALQEESFAREAVARKAVETKAKSMEDQICHLQKCLGEKNEQLHVSTSSAEQYLKDLDDIRSQLSLTQAAADASAASAQSAEAQCLSLLEELDEKNSSIKMHEDRINELSEQIDLLNKSVKAREHSQKQLKDEVARVEKEIMHAMAKAGSMEDCELRKLLEEVSPRNFENITKLLRVKDEEISRLRDEIRFLSAHWKRKTKELESQLEKNRRTDQELKKRVLKLEFCLQEARSQTRRLQRMGEKRDKALQELRDQLAMKQQSEDKCTAKQNIWESSGFKFVASLSMLVLVAFARR